MKHTVWAKITTDLGDSMANMKKVTILKNISTGEYRVPGPAGTEAQAYYTDDRQDAVGTAKHMWKGYDIIFTFRHVPDFDKFNNPPKRLRGYVRVDRKRHRLRKNPNREWHSEWRTTYNIMSKQARNDCDRKYIEGKRDANDDAVIEEDRRVYGEPERRHSNPRKKYKPFLEYADLPGGRVKRKTRKSRSTMKKSRRVTSFTKKHNPHKGAVEIYGNILAIEAKKGKGSLWPNERFRHGFKGQSEASVYGLPDGSILIKSKKGTRLWKNFKYKKGVDY